MKDLKGIKTYSAREEKINIASHAIGLVLGVVALVFLLNLSMRHGNAWHIVSFSIFGMSLVILYAASTVYHSVKELELRSRLRVIDHASIYVLIAGTYTPFTLVTLNGPIGWTIFGITWGMALCGIILKLFFTGKYNLVSTLMYVFMGWVIIFAINPLIASFPTDGLSWLVAGGMAYTIGAIIYSIKKIKFNHAIFHIFVLMGSGCHFVAVYHYILPS
jgi:hemolysin III